VRKKFFFLFVGAAGLVALAAPSASAARSTSAMSESAAACPGGTLLTAVSAQRLPAGVTAYKYNLPNGTSFENVAPPAGFNYMTANNGVLTELNMPTRPTGAAAMKAWEAVVAPFAKSGISRSEKFCEMATAAPEPEAPTAGQHAASVVPLGSVGHSGSTSFSGYELRSGPYARAVGRFTQPATGTDLRSMSTWIGLNGTGSGGRLIQAGAGDGAGYGGSPFWEQYCSGGKAAGCNAPVIDFGDSARPGASVSINVAYNKSTHMSYYQVSINGVLDINARDPMKSNSNSGDVVDFWTERTGGDSIPTSKAIPFSASRTYAAYNKGSSVAFGSQKYFATEMTSNGTFYNGGCSNSHILMFPNDVTSGGFVNNYCRSS
jgi:hypothetical protein